MKIINFLIFYILLFVFPAWGQNLIQNSTFDNYNTFLDSNNNLVYQPDYWFYNEKDKNHPIYYSSARYINKYLSINFHPDNVLIEKGQKVNYISILILPNTQKAYTMLKEPLIKGQFYQLQVDLKAFDQSNCISDILVGFKDSVDFTDSCSQELKLELPDTISNVFLFNNWFTLNTYFTSTGNEKVLVIAAGSKKDYLQIINSNTKKYSYKPFGGPYLLKYFIDNLYLTKIESKNDRLVDTKIDSLEIGDSFILENIYFEFDKYDLLKESFPMLDRLTDYLKRKSNVNIQVSGHTDNIGTIEYNNELSIKRAISVVEYLKSNGIDQSRLKPIGFGSSSPLDTNKTVEARQKNRRIEIKILNK
ncbi:MAG: OmpA family protein [Tenuifilaceae bacterium]